MAVSAAGTAQVDHIRHGDLSRCGHGDDEALAIAAAFAVDDINSDGLGAGLTCRRRPADQAGLRIDRHAGWKHAEAVGQGVVVTIAGIHVIAIILINGRRENRTGGNLRRVVLRRWRGRDGDLGGIRIAVDMAVVDDELGHVIANKIRGEAGESGPRGQAARTGCLRAC